MCLHTRCEGEMPAGAGCEPAPDALTTDESRGEGVSAMRMAFIDNIRWVRRRPSAAAAGVVSRAGPLAVFDPAAAASAPS